LKYKLPIEVLGLVLLPYICSKNGKMEKRLGIELEIKGRREMEYINPIFKNSKRITEKESKNISLLNMEEKRAIRRDKTSINLNSRYRDKCLNPLI
jgi:hypothetical protein